MRCKWKLLENSSKVGQTQIVDYWPLAFLPSGDWTPSSSLYFPWTLNKLFNFYAFLGLLGIIYKVTLPFRGKKKQVTNQWCILLIIIPDK